MNQAIAQLLYLTLVTIILSDFGHAIKQKPESYKVALSENKVAELSLRKDVNVKEFEATNSMDFVLTEPTTIFSNITIFVKTWLTIQPKEQIIRMSNRYDQVLVDLIGNAMWLKNQEGELKIDDSNYKSVKIWKNRGLLFSDYNTNHFGCKYQSLNIWYQHNILTFGKGTIGFSYDKSSKIVRIKNEDKELIVIDLVSRSTNDKISEKKWSDKPASNLDYNVTFNDNTAQIVCGDFNLTIDLADESPALVMKSPEANLIETPTSVRLECGVGKLEVKGKNGKKKVMRLTKMNELDNTESLIIMQENEVIISSANDRTVVRKAPNEETPLSIRGTYGSLKVVKKLQ